MRRRFIPIGLLVGAVFLASCNGSDAQPTTTTATEPAAAIKIADFAFSGATSVAVGQTVTVTNDDTTTHTWTSSTGVFDSDRLAPGDSFEFTFDEPGTYDYFCKIHKQMKGTITVEG